MKYFVLILMILLLNCQKKEVVYAPVGQLKEEKQIDISKNRARQLNTIERSLIEEWIKKQKIQFYDMPLNYWIDIDKLYQREARKKDDFIGYEYEIYDFENNKIYSFPKKTDGVYVGHFNDLKAIEDATLYLKKGEEATLLVPSVLAYGTYGDGDKIGTDVPLIIKLKMK